MPGSLGNQPGADGPLPPFQGWQPQRPTRPRLLRTGWLLTAAGIVAGAAAIVIAAAVLGRRSPARSPAAASAPADSAPVGSGVSVRSGEVMTAVLARAGLPDSVVGVAVDALRAGGFDFRRMLPGDSIVVICRDGNPERIFYHRSREQVWRLDLTSGSCRVSMLLPRVERRTGTVFGGIASSLYQALEDAGETPTLTMEFADVFGWEVDFFCETQPDDSFAVLVEKKYSDSAFIGYGRLTVARYWGDIGDLWAYRFTGPDGHTDCYNDEGLNLRKTFLRSPLSFSRVTSHFGRRFHPIRRIRQAHNGIDYAAPTGTPVSCVADGRVTFTGWKGGYGRTVEVTHGGSTVTRYGHLSRIGPGIRVGSSVVQGQVVGRVGSTGLSTGPHLHYEVLKSGTPVDPLRMEVPRAEPVPPACLEAFKALRDSLRARLLSDLAVRPQPPPAPGPR